MRLTLPRLDTTEPGELLAGLRGTTPLPAADTPEAGRTTSLPASITYSYAHLAGQTRRLLPAVSMLHGVADEDVLTSFSAEEGVPERFAGVSKQEWTAVLEDGARVGLLTGIGAGMYQIHPALPGYLAAAWHAEDPSGYDQEREACEQVLRTACAAFSERLTRQIQSGDAALAYEIIGLQRRTLGAMLGHALDHHAWNDGDGIVRALNAYWDTRGLAGEANDWTDRILEATVGHDQIPSASASSLWLYAISIRAARQMEAGLPDQARQTYQDALTYLRDQPETNWNRYHIAVTYHQLGNAAFLRERLDEADDWYRKSLTVREELGDHPGMAHSYHQLGMVARRRNRLDEADDWYRKSLTVKEELGDRRSMASSYAELGNIALLRGRLAEAVDWYLKAATIFEELGDRPNLALTYQGLGMTVQYGGRLEEAEDWYRLSLTISEELGNRGDMARTYAQLGLLAEDRAQAELALQWNIRCVTLFDQFPSPMTGTAPTALARLTRQLGMPALEAAWQQITSQPPPQAVRNYINNHDDDDQPGGTRHDRPRRRRGPFRRRDPRP
jgi:tetratricopeptide (TPR) repeat protein